MADRVTRIESDWRRLQPTSPVEAIGVSARCRMLSDLFFHAAQSSLAPFKLVPFEWEVLAMLMRQPAPHEASAGRIARETGRSCASITHRLDKLEQRGLVRRHASEIDGRLVLARLTPKGKRLATKAAGPRIDAAADAVSCLSRKEQKDLNVLLGKILQSHDPSGMEDV